jgi:hypothetical protein
LRQSNHEKAIKSIFRYICRGQFSTFNSELWPELIHRVGPWESLKQCVTGACLSTSRWVSLVVQLASTQRVATKLEQDGMKRNQDDLNLSLFKTTALNPCEIRSHAPQLQPPSWQAERIPLDHTTRANKGLPENSIFCASKANYRQISRFTKKFVGLTPRPYGGSLL